MKFYKKLDCEIIQRFNKDWSACDWFYYEVDENLRVLKQIQRTYEGLVYKQEAVQTSENASFIQIEACEEISKSEFQELWQKEFSNTYLVPQLQFDNHWNFAWYNIDYNKTEQELCDGNLILCGTYKNIFLLEIEYGEYNKFLSYSISEGSTNIKYGTADNWAEIISTVQLWINYIEQNADAVYSKPEKEKLERSIKILHNGELQDAAFTTYRNYDKDVEKFRSAYLSAGDSNYAHINTYTSMEDLLIGLQHSLPKNIELSTCLFCAYSNYNVFGNDNFGALNCFKHCKEKCTSLTNKEDVIHLFDTEYQDSIKVEETFYCNEFSRLQATNFSFKNTV
jgi:hypothetical protein